MGILGVALVFGLLLAGCDDPNGGGGGGGDGIPAKWQGTYTYGDKTNYVILGPTSGTYKISSATGSIPNITIGTGGTISGSGTGTWVYILTNGNKAGFVWEVTGYGTYGAFGYGGVTQHLSEADSGGLTFTPRPSNDGMNAADPWLTGDKE